MIFYSSRNSSDISLVNSETVFRNYVSDKSFEKSSGKCLCDSSNSFDTFNNSSVNRWINPQGIAQEVLSGLFLTILKEKSRKVQKKINGVFEEIPEQFLDILLEVFNGNPEQIIIKMD